MLLARCSDSITAHLKCLFAQHNQAGGQSNADLVTPMGLSGAGFASSGPSALHLINRFLGPFNLSLERVSSKSKGAPKTVFLSACNEAAANGRAIAKVCTKSLASMRRMHSRGIPEEVVQIFESAMLQTHSSDARACFYTGASLNMGVNLLDVAADQMVPNLVRALCPRLL